MTRSPTLKLRRLRSSALAAALLFAFSALAVQAQPAVSVRVVDTGPGLCTIAVIPGGFYMVFDAGHWLDSRCFEAVQELVPQGESIDLMVLSHSDSDHLAAADEILDSYSVETLLWAPYFRGIDQATIPIPATWKKVKKAIKTARKEGRLATEWSLASRRLDPGTEIRLGEATITLLAGFNRPPKAWGLEGNGNRSKHRNAGSVVLRLEYEGRSILFTGDAVGLLDDDDDGTDCIATERFLLDTFEEEELRADVVIAPHHGADNASCLRFLEAVRPEYVVFSAGHDHEHPRARAAERYLAVGVSPDGMLRTDLGDGEGDDEWAEGAGPLGVEDPVGDDDVEILLTAQDVTVRYRDH